MKASVILVGILLLVLFGAFSVQSLGTIDFFGIPINLTNPLYLIGSIALVTIFGFTLTINIVILFFAIIVLLAGVFSK